jgi:sulfite exporter TauE/SafE
MGVMVAWMGDRVQGLFGHGIQHILSVTTGLLMLLIYLLKPRWKLFSSSHSFLKGWSALSRQGDLMGHAAMGALNAFLPCGLVYVALAMALSTSVPWQGGLLMLSFGIGTSPLLCGIQLFKGRGLLRLKAMQWVKPTMVVSCSFVLILRGLGLGIPFLSPSINIESEETPSCCAAQQ